MHIDDIYHYCISYADVAISMSLEAYLGGTHISRTLCMIADDVDKLRKALLKGDVSKYIVDTSVLDERSLYIATRQLSGVVDSSVVEVEEVVRYAKSHRLPVVIIGRDRSRARYIESAIASAKGLRRSVNEDSALVASLCQSHQGRTSRYYIAAVADGVGGLSLGNVASSLAIMYFLVELALELLLCNDELDAIELSFITSHKYLLNYKKKSKVSNFGTTLTSALVTSNGGLYIGHVGDSRAYVIPSKGLVTRNHVVRDSILYQALGYGDKIKVDLHSGELKHGDCILLSTDGLTKYVTDDEIMNIVLGKGCLSEMVSALVDLACRRGGHDDISVAALRYRRPVSTSL